MNLVSQSRFADMLGCHRSHITRLKQAGRLVMVGKKVDVDASRARIDETKDPNRDDVARRHAEQRQNGGLPHEKDGDEVGTSYQSARALKEKYLALQAKADYERTIGELVPMSSVRLQGMDLGATVRVKLESLPHLLAPILAPIDDPAQVHALLVEKMEDALRELSRKMREMAEKMTE